MSAAVFDDILSLLLLAWLTGLMGEGGAPGIAEVAILSGKVGVFFICTTVVGLFVFPLGRTAHAPSQGP